MPGFPDQFVARKANGCEWRLSELAELDIVEANDRNIIGDALPDAADGAEGADGRQVIGREHSRWRLGKGEQFRHRRFSAVDFVGPLDHAALALTYATRADTFQECPASGPRRLQRHRPADETHALAPPLNNLPNRLLYS